jgi:hypothetical protein
LANAEKKRKVVCFDPEELLLQRKTDKKRTPKLGTGLGVFLCIDAAFEALL